MGRRWLKGEHIHRITLLPNSPGRLVDLPRHKMIGDSEQMTKRLNSGKHRSLMHVYLRLVTLLKLMLF